MHQFQIRKARSRGKVKYELYDKVEKEGRKASWEYVSCVSGWRISLLDHLVKKAKKGYRGEQPKQTNRFRVGEEDGVRLGLMFSGIQILHKMEKCEKIISTTQGMSREEAYYWYSKVRDKEFGGKGKRALRLLFE